MKFVFDADILSTFAKINKINLLKDIFGNNLLIPLAVEKDLKLAKAKFIKSIPKSNFFTIIKPSNKEINLANKITKLKTLGNGEIECISICKNRNYCFVSNDKKAIKFAENLDISIVDLETILCYLAETLNKDKLIQIISDIETKDKVIIVNKNKIISSSKF